MRTRLEKAAADNGFDQAPPENDGWLTFSSTKCPLWIWLAVDVATRPLVAFSQQKVAAALGALGKPTDEPAPLGARGLWSTEDIPSLHELLHRAFQLSRTLPNEPLRRFEAATKNLPRSTEVERLVLQRVGQNMFRDDLLDYWQGRCALTGLSITELLRASHIKPWAHCESDAERLDVFNGILLAPHLDAVFDRGFITIARGGEIVVSSLLSLSDRAALGVAGPRRIAGLAEDHEKYLPWHRANIFQAGPASGNIEV
jgi:putative restriction endonuclease